MATLTIELPDHLARELATKSIPRERLDSFVVEALQAWLQRLKAAAPGAVAWSGAFQGSAAKFVDQLIEDNQELFDELARK